MGTSASGEATTTAGDQSSLGRLGAFIKTQRKLANLSQRELAKLTNLSDPYVSQIERGLHEPSIRVVRAMSHALNIQVETMLAYAGLLEDAVKGENSATTTESAIRCDVGLTSDQKQSLLSVYRSFLTVNDAGKSDVSEGDAGKGDTGGVTA